MRMPLVWLNIMLATILILIYAQPDLFVPRKKPDYVLIAPAPMGGDRYAEMTRAAENFARDWRKEVVVIPSEEEPKQLAMALKRAVALGPRGVSMPGHNDEVLLPFVTEAQRRGIRVTFHTRPSMPAENRFRDWGTGYAGTHSEKDGEFAARAILERHPDPTSVNALIVGVKGSTAPGSRLHGCKQYLERQGAHVEVLEVAPPELVETDPALQARMAAEPRLDIIMWDAGPVTLATALLTENRYGVNDISLGTFDTTTTARLAEQAYVKRQFFEQRTLTAYVSLVQLYLADRHSVPGLHIPINASL